jgi:hypothetical protein
MKTAAVALGMNTIWLAKQRLDTLLPFRGKTEDQECCLRVVALPYQLTVVDPWQTLLQMASLEGKTRAEISLCGLRP